MNQLLLLKAKLAKVAKPARAKISQSFFKTGQGQYGEGDVFLGVTVPDQRRIAYQFLGLSLQKIKQLLQSKIHEHRFVALEILVAKFERASDKKTRVEIGKFYLNNIPRINNWDLVDTSAPYILGPYAELSSPEFIYRLSRSNNLWSRRIAILTTFHFLAQRNFTHSLNLAKQLISDDQDLIQKALGWMLREIGKRDEKVLLKFLNSHYKRMPRTMLRYSIERLSSNRRKFYLQK